MTYKIKNQDIILNIYIQPAARVSQLSGLHDGRIKLKVSAPPVDGAANKAVVDFFAKFFLVAKSKVLIISGEKSRNKVVLVKDYSPEVLEKIKEVIQNV